jgi:tetratricopeptide (TPR) repeat protein
MKIGFFPLLFAALLPAGFGIARAATPDMDPPRLTPLRQAAEWSAAADALMKQGSWDEARRTYLKLHASLATALGPDHPQAVVALANACDASVRLTARLDSLRLCERALDLTEKTTGSNSPETVRAISDLSLLYAADGDLNRAGKLLSRALRIASADLHSKEVAGLMNNLGYLYFRQGKYNRSRDMFERASVAVENGGVTSDGSDLVTILGNLGTAELAAHHPVAAERHFRRALFIAEASPATNPAKIRKALDDLSHAEAALGKRGAAAVVAEAVK